MLKIIKFKLQKLIKITKFYGSSLLKQGLLEYTKDFDSNSALSLIEEIKNNSLPAEPDKERIKSDKLYNQIFSIGLPFKWMSATDPQARLEDFADYQNFILYPRSEVAQFFKIVNQDQRKQMHVAAPQGIGKSMSALFFTFLKRIAGKQEKQLQQRRIFLIHDAQNFFKLPFEYFLAEFKYAFEKEIAENAILQELISKIREESIENNKFDQIKVLWHNANRILSKEQIQTLVIIDQFNVLDRISRTKNQYEKSIYEIPFKLIELIQTNIENQRTILISSMINQTLYQTQACPLYIIQPESQIQESTKRFIIDSLRTNYPNLTESQVIKLVPEIIEMAGNNFLQIIQICNKNNNNLVITESKGIVISQNYLEQEKSKMKFMMKNFIKEASSDQQQLIKRTMQHLLIKLITNSKQIAFGSLEPLSFDERFCFLDKNRQISILYPLVLGVMKEIYSKLQDDLDLLETIVNLKLNGSVRGTLLEHTILKFHNKELSVNLLAKKEQEEKQQQFQIRIYINGNDFIQISNTADQIQKYFDDQIYQQKQQQLTQGKNNNDSNKTKNSLKNKKNKKQSKSKDKSSNKISDDDDDDSDAKKDEEILDRAYFRPKYTNFPLFDAILINNRKMFLLQIKKNARDVDLDTLYDILELIQKHKLELSKHGKCLDSEKNKREIEEVGTTSYKLLEQILAISEQHKIKLHYCFIAGTTEKLKKEISSILEEEEEDDEEDEQDKNFKVKKKEFLNQIYLISAEEHLLSLGIQKEKVDQFLR